VVVKHFLLFQFREPLLQNPDDCTARLLGRLIDTDPCTAKHLRRPSHCLTVEDVNILPTLACLGPLLGWLGHFLGLDHVVDCSSLLLVFESLLDLLLLDLGVLHHWGADNLFNHNWPLDRNVVSGRLPVFF